MNQPNAKAVRHYYKAQRQHQRDLQAAGSGTLTMYPSGRVERSYASAPYGEHALSAFTAAKRHAFFMRSRRSAL